jgi:transposase InsO family protein
LSQACSISARRSYGLARVCRVLEVARSTVYARRDRAEQARPVGRPGPKRGIVSDADLLVAIQAVLAASPFHGEGYRKVWARLRAKSVRVDKDRVRRLMGRAGLLVPQRGGTAHGPAAHDGTITTERPDEMWGTDATQTVTIEQGTATIFAVVDHCTAECVGIHAALRGNRFEAIEPLRQGVTAHFGAYEKGVAEGLAVRHDHGSQFLSGHYQGELSFLGIASSPAFVREPEGNGCVERFWRTLKEQLLWVRTFRTVEELRVALQEFRDLYNRAWIVQKHGFLTPSQVREKLTARQEVAA